jgi:AmmeMemoRadiSam system protein B
MWLSEPRSVAMREPAVAGTFYPALPRALAELVDRQFDEAAHLPAEGAKSWTASTEPLGLLVPHAGLAYSGVVAAAGWRLLAGSARAPKPASPAPTIVVLGTNHRAAWLDGIGAWERGSWETPLGEVEVASDLAASILALGPPFVTDPRAHLEEHSIEVQLPFVQRVLPDARIVPLAVAAGIGPAAIDAGARLGTLLAQRRASGDAVVLAISSDMAHYPTHAEATRITARLLPAILALDPVELARRERALVGDGFAGVACGMCGIEPAVLGLAALAAMSAAPGVRIASATSADAGGDTERTVGYLTVAFGPA